MVWPVRPLNQSDIIGGAFLSNNPSYSASSSFLDLFDTPSTYKGQTGKVVSVKTGENGLEFTTAAAGGGFDPDRIFLVDAGGSLTSFNGTAYTDIQTALDAANALTPSVTNQYLVAIVPGVYDEGELTLYSYVHLAGLGITGPGYDTSRQMGTHIGLGHASSGTPCISSVDNVTISNISFYYNGQVGHTEFMSIDHSTITFNDCDFSNTASTLPMDVNEGRFNRCLFDNNLMTIEGGAEFNDCKWITDSAPSKTCTISGEAFWNNCTFYSNGAYSGTQGLQITSPSFRMNGGWIEAIGGQHIEIEGEFTGVNFDVVQQASSSANVIPTIEVTGGTSFSGCTFNLQQTTTGNTGTVGVITILDLTGGDVIFSGCTIKTDGDNAILMLSSSISDTNAYRVVVTGCTLYAHDTSSSLGHIFDIHSSGFSGNVIVELSGNYYFHDSFSSYSTMPTNAGSGLIKWRGSDIKSVFHPVDSSLSTAIVNVDNFPAAELDLANEVAYVTGRNAVPGGLLVDAALVLSAQNSDGIQIDDFTDSDGTNLSAHTPTGGGTGTWTAAAGTITVVTNRANCSASGVNIYTYSIAGSNGFMTGLPTAGTGTGTNSIGFLFRYADSSNYWRLVTVDDSPRFRLIKRVGGSETTVMSDTTVTNNPAVSFCGNTIRVWEGWGTANVRLRASIDDSALAANTTVGIYCSRTGGTHTLDNWEFWPGGDVDLTNETVQAGWLEPFDASPASSDDNGVDVLHHAYSLHDVAVGVGEDLWNVKTTLDVLNGNISDVRVHGIITRHLPVNNTDNYSSTETGEPNIGMVIR